MKYVDERRYVDTHINLTHLKGVSRETVKVGEWDHFKGLTWERLSDAIEQNKEGMYLLCEEFVFTVNIFRIRSKFAGFEGGHKGGAPIRYVLFLL